MQDLYRICRASEFHSRFDHQQCGSVSAIGVSQQNVLKTHRTAAKQKLRRAGHGDLGIQLSRRDTRPHNALKYQGMIELTNYIAELVAELAARGKLSMPSHNLVTVIPSHWQRRLTRGFDPVWLLANALAKKGVIDKPLSTLKVSRMRPYQHLKRLDERYIDPDHFQARESVLRKKDSSSRRCGHEWFDPECGCSRIERCWCAVD